jgi:cyclopropane fatty-acyl-phospholipid synthase-like methyltransferase
MVTAAEYLKHASEINKIAGIALRLESRNATAIAAKISIGLSLQAIELAGKSILRALGHSVEDIRQHRKHDLITLLRQAQTELQQRTEKGLDPYRHFLLWTPTIDGILMGNTILAYFERHFAEGATAFPRNYFYPDESVFTGPVPIHAIKIIAQYIIEVAENIDNIIEG